MMGTRRTDGEGSYGRTSDGRFSFTRQVTLPDGRQKRVKGEGKSRTLARQRCERRIAALVAPPAPPPPSPKTVGEQVEYWMDVTHRHGRATTVRAYRQCIKNLITPALGQLRLVEMKPSHVKRWLTDLDGTGRSASYIGMAYKLVKAALDLAVQDELLARNPLMGVRPPRLPRTSGKTLTVEQARRLLAAARGHRLELAMRLMLGLGLRRGEVAGLRWQDIDLELGTLTICGSATYTPETGTIYGGAKTPESERTILLPEQLLTAIREHQARQADERAAMRWGATMYVFTAVTSGSLINPTIIYAAFRMIAREIGLEGFRLHDLRHSAATFLLAEGTKIKRVQAILGHASATTTMNVYAHLLAGDDSEALERLQKRLENEEPC